MKKLVCLCFMLVFSGVANAYKECNEKVKSIYVGDNGIFWVTFDDGGATHLTDSDPDFDNMLSILLVASTSDRTVTMRYNSADATCSETRADLRGIWLR